MKVYVESKDDIVEATTDSRGRLTLGSEYANEQVTIAVLERDRDDLETCPECGMGPRGIEDGVCQNCGYESDSISNSDQ